MGIGPHDLAAMSLRELFACVEAHHEYHGGKSTSGEMSEDRARELGIVGF